ncbi:DUF7845 domain-containing protein [Halopiger goleimassiliensis]|uniref:DUF7845 domain-containing protein n=1 Tax=Halopiger goleimassiliensis TaxID=1293048 RepID=UPI0009DC3A94|nr:MarR family transcriptional regulator [Halopiger goleimassiliensis]
MTSGPIKAVEPAYHEFDANAIFPTLKPWFAADHTLKQSGGSATGEFTRDGQRWVVKLYYTEGNLLPPESGETPAGTPIEFETIREPRFKIYRHPDEDPTGEQDFSVHMAPRWQGLRAEKGDGTETEIDIPPSLIEGVNCRIQGSNIPFDRYVPLLREAAAVVGINSDYFRDLHAASNVQDAAVYVRVDTDESGPVHARDGPIASMAHLLENDREGYRKLVQNDDDERGRNLPGYYHTVTLGPRRIGEAFPSHHTPKEVKHYYAREAKSLPKTDPLRHPKVEAAYQASRWDETIHWDDLERLYDELTETVLSVLADAGLPLEPRESDGHPYVPDAYFDADSTLYEDNPVTTLNLTRIRNEQESVVIRHVADGLSPVQWESLRTLVTDGGEVSPTDIADENDRHPESVRRALRQLDDLVEREYNRVSLASNYVGELVHDAIQDAKNATRRAVETGAKALEAADRDLDEATSALVAWASRHGLRLNETDEYVKIEFDRLEAESLEEAKREIRRALRDGMGLWADAERDPSKFIGGEYTAVVSYDKYPDATYLTEQVTTTIGGTIGQELPT